MEIRSNDFRRLLISINYARSLRHDEAELTHDEAELIDDEAELIDDEAELSSLFYGEFL